MLTHTEKKVIHLVKEKELWDNIVTQFPEADIYYTHDYCKWAAEAENGEAKLVYFRGESGSIIYPIILRNVNFTQEENIYDITSPYGYGGPLLSGSSDTLTDFKDSFSKYCRESRIISEVIRLHPLVNNSSYLSNYCTVQYVRQTTAVNLLPSLNAIRDNYSKMNKRNIKKAVKNDIVCMEVEKNQDNISTFYDLYKETMQRKAASSYYLFDKSSLSKQLFDSAISKAHLIFAYAGSTVVSAVILFTTKNSAHYHLGASRREFLNLRPNNIIFDYMVKLSKEKNCTMLHLGGGYEENDNLFLYKTSFSNNNNFDFFIGKNIYDDELYRVLENRAGINSDSNNSFFPSYRAPVKEKA